MKYFVIFSLCLVALVAAGPQEAKEEIKQAADQCRDEAGITASELDEWKKNKETVSDEDKNRMACLSACVMKKLKVMEGTVLNVELMKEKAEGLHMEDPQRKEEMNKAIDECHEQVKEETEECPKAQNFLSCLMKHHQNHGHASEEHPQAA